MGYAGESLSSRESLKSPHFTDKELLVARLWWHTTLFPALGGHRLAELSEFEASLVYRFPGQPRLRRETLSQKNQTYKFILPTRNAGMGDEALTEGMANQQLGQLETIPWASTNP